MEVAFDVYFRGVDLDCGDQIRGEEAVAFFKGSSLPQPVLTQLSNAGGCLIISRDCVWDALTAGMAFRCARGIPPEAAAEQIVKEAVEAKGLRDDTTCIIIDIIPPEKPKCTIESLDGHCFA